MIKEVFEVSEKYDILVLYRVIIRFCYLKGLVECYDREEVEIKEYVKNVKKMVIVLVNV